MVLGKKQNNKVIKQMGGGSCLDNFDLICSLAYIIINAYFCLLLLIINY